MQVVLLQHYFSVFKASCVIWMHNSHWSLAKHSNCLNQTVGLFEYSTSNQIYLLSKINALSPRKVHRHHCTNENLQRCIQNHSMNVKKFKKFMHEINLHVDLKISCLFVINFLLWEEKMEYFLRKLFDSRFSNFLFSLCDFRNQSHFYFFDSKWQFSLM